MNKSNQIVVILNPAAHGERARALREEILGLSSAITIRDTHSPGDARDIAIQAANEGCRAVIAAGGDGTVNEVVNGLAGSQIPFGILPIGTMNVFATELGLPMGDLTKAWGVVDSGSIREIDLPEANGACFVQLAGVGLDAEVVRQTTSDSKRALGPVSYLLALAQVAGRRPPTVTIEPEGGPIRQGRFVLIGNGRFYGGPFVLFKDARLDDGLLDILIFKNQSHWDVIRYFQAIAFGSHLELPDVEYFQSRRVRLTSDEDVPVELDGELSGRLPVDFGISSERLKIFAPPAK